MNIVTNEIVEKAAIAIAAGICLDAYACIKAKMTSRGNACNCLNTAMTVLEAVADDLVRAEREATAKIADRCAYGWSMTPPKVQTLHLDSEVAVETAEAIAAAIRARSQKTKEQS